MALKKHPLDQLKDLERLIAYSAEKGLEAVGYQAIKEYRLAESDSDDTGRLADSFSWATTKAASGVGGLAQESDHVKAPTKALTLSTGSDCPYALALDMGAGPSTSESFDTLLPKIREWGGRHGILDPLFIGALTERIIEYGTNAHPYIDVANTQIQIKAPATHKEATKVAFDKVTAYTHR